MSAIQRLFAAFLSPKAAADMEAESRSWMVQCPSCGFERSVWDLGGVRWKAAGSLRTHTRCPQCGKAGWHKVYRQQPAQPDESS